jgi:uncharacterized membrane protein
MRRITRDTALHVVFWTGIIFKGIDGVLETIGGVALLVVSTRFIRDLVHLVFREELFEDPHDLLANYLVNLADQLSVSTKTFAAVYLLVHGVIKMGLVGAIWRKRLWAYPLTGVVFSLFVVYQVARFVFTHSLMLVLVTVVDIIIIALLPHEYRRLSQRIRQSELR